MANKRKANVIDDHGVEIYEGDLSKIEIFYTNNQMSTIQFKKEYGREVYKEMLTKLKEEW